MNSEENLKEYDILGYKVKISSNEQRSEAELAIALLNKELRGLEGKAGSAAEKILMAALKIAAERVRMQNFFMQELAALEVMIDEPTTVNNENSSAIKNIFHDSAPNHLN